MYLLDTNAFLTPASTYYAFDICGGYWDWLLAAAQRREVASIDRVKRELREKDDQVRHWIDYHANDLFQSETTETGRNMTDVAIWSASGSYTAAATAEFLNKADAFLIAHAMGGGHEVVTLEASAPAAISKIKIPDACSAHGITCISPYELLRRHGARLVL